MGQNLQDGENLRYSSYFFWKGKAGAGCEMKVSNFGQVLPFPNRWGNLNYWRKKIWKTYFDGFFWWIFWEIFSLYWKTRQLEHWKSPFIWHIWIFCCILRKRAWSELFKTPLTWFNPIILIWMLIVRSWGIFRKCENLKISQLRIAGKHAIIIGFI